MAKLKLSDSFSDIVDWCKAHVTKSNVFIDVGANEGMVSLHAMWNCNPILTILIEAAPYFDELLPQNMKELAPNDRYVIVRKLALHEVGERILYHPIMSPSQSSVFDRFTRNRENMVEVKLPVTTVDEVVKEFYVNDPIILKIDTELSEPLVWEGMKRSMPIISDAVVEFMPDAMRNDAKLVPEEFLQRVINDGFEILTLQGEKLSVEDALQFGKTDLWLRNTNYGYI